MAFPPYWIVLAFFYSNYIKIASQMHFLQTSFAQNQHLDDILNNGNLTSTHYANSNFTTLQRNDAFGHDVKRSSTVEGNNSSSSRGSKSSNTRGGNSSSRNRGCSSGNNSSILKNSTSWNNLNRLQDSSFNILINVINPKNKTSRFVVQRNEHSTLSQDKNDTAILQDNTQGLNFDFDNNMSVDNTIATSSCVNTSSTDPDGSKQSASTPPERVSNNIFLYGNGSSLQLNTTNSTTLQDLESNANALLRREQECQNLFTRNAYKLDGCDAPDIESYLERHKSRFTCVGRCDRKPKYVGPTTKDCSCDALCVFYRVCCRDMPRVCPETYHRGQEVYSHLESAETDCLTAHYFLVEQRTMNTYRPSGRTPYPTRTVQGTTLGGYAERVLDSRTGFRKLQEYFGPLDTFLVADVTFGVIFLDFDAFKSWSVPSSVPLFVPKVVSLNCTGVYGKYFPFANAEEYLESCTVLSHTHAPTDIRRSCAILEVLNCYCVDTDEIVTRDFLQDSCQGQYNNMTLFKRDKIIPRHLNFPTIFERMQCALTTHSFCEHVEKSKTESLSREK